VVCQPGPQESLYLVSSVKDPEVSLRLHAWGKDVGLRGLIMATLGFIFIANDR
jgi:hypothetical protein